MAIDTFWPWRVAFKKFFADVGEIKTLVVNKMSTSGQAILGSAEVKDDLSVGGDITVNGNLNLNLPPNSSAKTVDKTAGTTVFAEDLAAKTEVVKLRYVITQTFQGCTMELGDGTDPDAFISDANFPKTAGSGVVEIGVVPTNAFDIVLTVGEGGTAGAGWFKVEWSP
jgi:hypothetical protein